MAQAWTLTPPITPSPALLATVGGHPLIAQLLAQRGIDTPEKARAFLDPTFYRPTPPSALLGIDHAAEVLKDAIERRQNILVWGDFDVDGQTSTALLVSALRQLAGDERIHFHVPNRFTESHGIRLPKLQEKLTDPNFRPNVIVTCDTGISEGEAIAVAKAAGLTVVVTDHHDPPQEILDLGLRIAELWADPETIHNPQSAIRNLHPVLLADAIVNPKLQPEGDPLRTLPGVGVAYKLVQRLFAICGHAGEESELLDLVALGIVADVAEQVNDARYLLQMGLEQLRKTRRAGLLALMSVARINPAHLSAESIGFQLGPRMNALGRLEDATVSVELLTTRDAIRAGQLAAMLERLNQERRLLTSQTSAAALDMIERNPSLLDHNVLMLNHPGWHAGIVGIVAARLVDEFGKPTLLLLNPPGENARGSARSIPGVDIGASIAACSHLLLTHGGHPGAAGVSLLPENIDRFRRELSQQIDLHRDENVVTGLQIDAELGLEMLNLDLAHEINRIAPFGNGNPTPQFLCRGLNVVEDQRIGREGKHRKLHVQRPSDAIPTNTTPTNNLKLPVLWFDGADATIPPGPINLVYQININDYRGERTLQLNHVAIRPAQEITVDVRPSVGMLQLHDLRKQTLDPSDLPQPGAAIWYAEGTLLEADAKIAYAPRSDLATPPLPTDSLPTLPLILWSIPPSPDLLAWLVETSAASEVYLCGREVTDDSLDSVLKAVASMCKFALGRDHLLDLGRMAARLGTTESVIRHSLLWLESRGLVRIEQWLGGDSLRIGEGGGARRSEDADELQAQLKQKLAEVRAYRRFFLRAKISELALQ